MCAENPGHVGSSLGAVELIVGMHYVFDAPKDKIVFDVGHQAYAHKILTGRREAFKGLRTAGGISGFPNIFESPYDAFGTGHSSTAISAALGFAESARMQNNPCKVAALVGDGALTGGMAFEGLNNAGISRANLLVIVNDNNQSIDANLGALHNHLLKITTSAHYNAMKNRVWDMLGESSFRAFLQRWTRSVKSWFVKKSGGDIFEALGFRYFGPIDGNDIRQVVTTLQKIYNMKGPRVLHTITLKGKGYPAAEADPATWHSPGKFNPETGERVPAKYAADRYQDVFGQVLCDLSDKDSRVVGITPAMGSGCGMNIFEKHRPDRFFDVGIEEEHAVTFSAGLAAGGMKPFCNIYSSFSQRAYDQIVHDVALQKLPVVLCFDRAGLVGEDGATHQGAFDIAALRSIPNVTIAAPSDELELKNLMYTALHCDEGPFVIRYPRGCGEGVSWRKEPFKLMAVGKAYELSKGNDIALIATGPVVNQALKAAEGFEGRVGVYSFPFVKPFDTQMFEKIISTGYRHIITLEDGAVKGGLYSEVCERVAAGARTGIVAGAGTAAGPGTAAAAGAAITVHSLGIPDRFITQDKQSAQRSACGLDVAGIRAKIAELSSI